MQAWLHGKIPKNLCKSTMLLTVLLAQISCGGGSGSTNGSAPITMGDGTTDSTGELTSLTGSSCAEILNGGELGASFTLINTASACDYYLKGELVLRGQLTIEAGTTVVAAVDSELRINGGALVAVGTQSNPITFQGEARSRGFWKGIALFDALPSRLEHVVIADAGQVKETRFEPHAALDVFGSIVSVVNTSVSNSFVNGVSFANDTEISAFQNNEFYGNRLAGLTLSPELVNELDKGSDYLGIRIPNGNPVIEVHDSDFSAEPVENAVWQSLNAPYNTLSQIGLSDDREQLTLEAGVEIITSERIFSPVYVLRGGRLIAKGTPESPIRFTADVTDTEGHSIEIATDGIAEFEHVSINGYDSGVVLRGGTVSISQAELNVATGYGIRCDSSVRENSLTIGDAVTVSDNAEALLSPGCF